MPDTTESVAGVFAGTGGRMKAVVTETLSAVVIDAVRVRLGMLAAESPASELGYVGEAGRVS